MSLQLTQCHPVSGMICRGQEAILNFYRSQWVWIAFAILAVLLLVAVNYEIKVVASVHKKDLGNGVVIYADDYVETGVWVFDCKYSRLISREPLSVLIAELEGNNKIAVYDSPLTEDELVLARDVIESVTKLPQWQKQLRYLYSILGEDSSLKTHMFDMLTSKDGQQWAVSVIQHIGNDGQSRFQITAEPYNNAIYVDYAKALQVAAKSCPIPQ
ncbi:hypothetical protein WG219_18470 [Ectopseudomonas mendocina]|uniref:Transmembrane protein n=1 Tax=Ectopseudomonas mendocina TaxID=300 RepID=A0ABZ2RMA5_ECTME